MLPMGLSLPQLPSFQHAATQCNTVQHTATHSVTHHTTLQKSQYLVCKTRLPRAPGHCNALQHTATHCNILQHTATHCNMLQHTATHFNTLQHTVTYGNTLQHTATHYLVGNTSLPRTFGFLCSCNLILVSMLATHRNNV